MENCDFGRAFGPRVASCVGPEAKCLGVAIDLPVPMEPQALPRVGKVAPKLSLVASPDGTEMTDVWDIR